MIVATTDAVPGYRIVRTLGLVRGNTIRTRHLGKDILAAFKNLVGGEVMEYTKMLAESREQAIDRMIEDAEAVGANAIVGLRFTTASMMQGAAELLAYGTAVVVEEDRSVGASTCLLHEASSTYAAGGKKLRRPPGISYTREQAGQRVLPRPQWPGYTEYRDGI